MRMLRQGQQPNAEPEYRGRLQAQRVDRARLTVAVREVTSTIKKQTVTVKGKKRGFFESVTKKHPVEVTFLTEAGQTAKAKTTAR